MKRLLSVSFAIAGLAFSSGVFSATCQTSGHSNVGSNPKGKEYPVRGEASTYYHDGETGNAWYAGLEAQFTTSEGYVGYDEYNYQDFKYRAKKSITFNYRGPSWVYVYDPEKKIPFCNNVYVQNRPTISKVSWSAQTKQAKVNYSVDTYSKLARENKPRAITFRWREDTYGTEGIGATVSTSSLSGSATATLSFPGGGIYSIEARISDGTYSASVPMGWINLGPAQPPCDRCNKD